MRWDCCASGCESVWESRHCNNSILNESGPVEPRRRLMWQRFGFTGRGVEPLCCSPAKTSFTNADVKREKKREAKNRGVSFHNLRAARVLTLASGMLKLVVCSCQSLYCCSEAATFTLQSEENDGLCFGTSCAQDRTSLSG